MPHPFALPPKLSPHLGACFVRQPDEHRQLVERRLRVSGLLRQLRDAVDCHMVMWSDFVHERTRKIVCNRCVPFCAEVSFVTIWPDPTLWAHYVQGLPMLG